MKSITTINTAIRENMKCSIVKVYALFINWKVGALLQNHNTCIAAAAIGKKSFFQD